MKENYITKAINMLVATIYLLCIIITPFIYLHYIFLQTYNSVLCNLACTITLYKLGHVKFGT